jgi:hypothetical protein
VMNKVEANQLLTERLEDLRSRPYSELLRLMETTETTEIVGASGTRYQVETEAVWDEKRGKNLRVIVSIDDFGWRAFAPLTSGFIKTPGD